MPEYTIPLRCATKKRPQVVARHCTKTSGKIWARMDDKYVAWQQECADMLRALNFGPPLAGDLSLDLFITLTGWKRGDVDNYAGAFMDAAQDILFTNDRNFFHLCVDVRPYQPTDSITFSITTIPNITQPKRRPLGRNHRRAVATCCDYTHAANETQNSTHSS